MASNQKDVFGRLASVVTDMPGSAKLLDAVHAVRERLDDMQARIRSLDPLERRVTELERRLDELTGGPGKKRTAAKKTASTAAGKTAASAKKKKTA